MKTIENRCIKGFDEVFEGWRYLLKADLERLDYRARQMITEMKLESVTAEYIAEYLPIMFKSLAEEVLREQNAAHRKPKRKKVIS